MRLRHRLKLAESNESKCRIARLDPGTDPGTADRDPQTVTAWQAMRMMTVEPALALHVEEQLGTLEPGKLADIVVLSESPLSIAPARLGELRIELTVIDGLIEWDDMEAEH